MLFNNIIFWIKQNQLKQYDGCFVTATGLVFPSEDIGIHIKSKHNVAPGNIYTKG